MINYLSFFFFYKKLLKCRYLCIKKSFPNFLFGTQEAQRKSLSNAYIFYPVKIYFKGLHTTHGKKKTRLSLSQKPILLLKFCHKKGPKKVRRFIKKINLNSAFPNDLKNNVSGHYKAPTPSPRTNNC